MRGVSKRATSVFALAVVVLVLGSQPALAASRDKVGVSGVLRTFARRVLDLIDIRFPPG